MRSNDHDCLQTSQFLKKKSILVTEIKKKSKKGEKKLEPLTKAFYTEVSFFHLIKSPPYPTQPLKRKAAMKTALVPSWEETHMQSTIGHNIYIREIA